MFFSIFVIFFESGNYIFVTVGFILDKLTDNDNKWTEIVIINNYYLHWSYLLYYRNIEIPPIRDLYFVLLDGCAQYIQGMVDTVSYIL